jgi:uncharacterized protein (UPF0335 family)
MAKATNYGGVSGQHLRQYIERIERLEEDKKVIAEDIKEVFAEAKANGFDVKIMRKVISLRKLDAAEREEIETLIDVYKAALGMIPSADDADEAEAA